MTDRFYTNGLYFGYQLGYDSEELIHDINPARWMFAALRPLTDLEDPDTIQGSPAGNFQKGDLNFSPFLARSELYLGLNTYTPMHLIKRSISYGDRPYASHAFAGTSFSAHSHNESLATYVELGTMGPRTGSREGQTWIHTATEQASTPPNGWDYQMPSTGGLDVGVQYERVYDMDRSGNLRAGYFLEPRLGMMRTSLDLGGVFLYQPESGSRSSGRILGVQAPRYEFFIRPSIRYVGYDATLEGPMGTSMNIYQEDEEEAYLAFSASMDRTWTRPENQVEREILKRSLFQKLYVERNTADYRENLIRFQLAYYQDRQASFGEKVLIYEALFRETNPYSYDGEFRQEETREVVILSLILEGEEVTPENLYFWNATLNQKSGDSLPILARWIAFDKLTAPSNLTFEEKVSIFAVLFHGRRFDNRPYGVKPVRTVFENEAGVQLGNDTIRGRFSWSGQSDTFESVEGIVDFDVWWSASVTVYM